MTSRPAPATPSTPGASVLDPLDAAIAAALQADARATWRDLAARLGASETTIARRANALIERRLIRPTLAIDAHRCGLGTPAFVHLLCTNGQAAQVGRELAERDDVRFVALVTGAFDIVAEFVVPSIDRLADILIDDLAAIPNVARSNTELVLRNFMTSYSWATDVENRIHEGTSAAEEANGATSALDPSDLALVREVQNDGRISIARLAATLGISEPAARRRLDALISSRQVLPIALVSPRVLGFSIEALVWCRIDLQELEPTADVLAAYPGVRYVSATNGSYDLVAEMVLRSRDDLDRFRTEFLSHLHAIRRFDISLELRTLKRAYCLLGYERR